MFIYTLSQFKEMEMRYFKREEGIKEGRELGRKEGIELGIKEGIELARKEAIELAREEGIKEVKKEIAIKSLPFLNNEIISKITDYSIEEIQAMREKHTK